MDPEFLKYVEERGEQAKRVKELEARLATADRLADIASSVASTLNIPALTLAVTAYEAS